MLEGNLPEFGHFYDSCQTKLLLAIRFKEGTMAVEGDQSVLMKSLSPWGAFIRGRLPIIQLRYRNEHP
jgi:hypothetical protein